MKAKIILDNGMSFDGYTFGYLAETTGDIVINTCMFGYEKIISNPAYCNQILVMTYPLIGNYGIELDNCESLSPTLNALIVNEFEKKPTHIKCELDLESYLKSNNIVGIYGVDTRELTRVLRSYGKMNAKILIEEKSSEIAEKTINNENPVEIVSTKTPYIFSEGSKKLAVLDLGIKISSLKYLSSKDYQVKVFPYNTDPEEILNYNPEIIIISDGPGSPFNLSKFKEVVLKLSDKKPILAISLGHQLLNLAFGGLVNNLKLGHRGNNYPVKDIKRNRIYTTSQNTDFYVSQEPETFDIIFEGVNEKIIQATKHKTKPIASFQFDILSNDFDFIFDELTKGDYYAER